MKKAIIATLLSTMAVAQALAQSHDHDTPVTAQDMERAFERAAETVSQMQPEERIRLTYGVMPLSLNPDAPPPPEGSIPGAGYVAGISRLGIPALLETDGPLGVTYIGGIRQDFATAFPSGVAMGSTFNSDLLYEGGAVIGAEARAKGFNVVLAGGANLMRDPRNGRTFEYLSEDPLLTGALVGSTIAGIQSNHIISTIKHFALNGQETGRKYVDVLIDDASARESDLLAFQIGIERGQPGAVMCAYNRVNGEQGCASEYLLQTVLKDDWGYRGFVLSDWGAVPGLYAAINGLDQQSAAELDPDNFFDETLLEAAESDPAYARRLDDMNRRILTAIYATGLDENPVSPGGEVDYAAHSQTALEIARQGIVLLKNERDVLPLARDARHIAVIGGYADAGVLSGAGSSQTHSEGGPALIRPLGDMGPFSFLLSQQYHRSSPLAALRERLPDTRINFRDGRYITDAVSQARQADVAIVFATQWMTEGLDVPDLSLPDGQDALIAAVAAANPNTIVVLETGGPVDMPWLDQVAAVVEAWYPGMRGGEAIAEVLLGEVNPSGHLPITFPRSVEDLPRAEIAGAETVEPNFGGEVSDPDIQLVTDYRIEGSDLGYRWNARTGRQALFPFGFGLSYTGFAHGDFTTDGRTANFTVTNTGSRAGADVVQVYLIGRNGEAIQRLVGFARVDLAPGEAKSVSVEIDPRLLAEWSGDSWEIAAGSYRFGLATDAETISATQEVELEQRRWTD